MFHYKIDKHARWMWAQRRLRITYQSMKGQKCCCCEPSCKEAEKKNRKCNSVITHKTIYRKVYRRYSKLWPEVVRQAWHWRLQSCSRWCWTDASMNNVLAGYLRRYLRHDVQNLRNFKRSFCQSCLTTFARNFEYLLQYNLSIKGFLFHNALLFYIFL